MALPPGVCVAAAEYVLWYLYSGVLREGPLAVHRVTRGALELARLWEVEAVATFVGRLLQRRFSDTLATAVPLPAAAAAADAPAAAGSALQQPQQQRRRFQLCRAAGADLVLRCCDAERGTVAFSCSRVLLCAQQQLLQRHARAGALGRGTRRRSEHRRGQGRRWLLRRWWARRMSKCCFTSCILTSCQR